MPPPPEHDDLIGLSLDARFRLDALVGEGGMGRVYRATDLSNGDTVAVKVLLDLHTGDHVMTSRFQREAEIIASLRHRAIVGVYHVGDDAALGLIYLVMDFLEGPTLADVTSRGTLDWRSALRLTALVADGLDVAHRARIVHRDLKPENILLRVSEGGAVQPTILDFGVALPHDVAARLTVEGTVCGTAAYMAPEQARAQTVGPAADIYALGVTLYEMLTGTLPIDAATPFEIVLRKLREPAAPITSRLPPRSDLPAGAAQLIAAMLERDPEQRIDDATEVARRIRQIVGNDLTLAVDPRAAEPFDGWFSRDRTLVEPILDRRVADPETRRERAPIPPPAAPTRVPAAERRSRRLIAGVAALVAIVAVAATLVLLLTAGDEQSVHRVERPFDSADEHLAVQSSPAPTDREPTPPPGPDLGSPSNDVGPADASRDAFEADLQATNDSSGCGVKPPFEGVRWLATYFEGAKQSWLVYLPANYDEHRRHPVLLLFHDSTLSAPYILEKRGFKEVADREGIILIAFDARQQVGSWRAADEVDFTFRALRETRRVTCVDDQKIFAMGHGSGGYFIAERLACKMPLSGIAVTGYRPIISAVLCNPEPPIPFMEAIGDKDPGTPAAGGPNCLGSPIRSKKEFLAEMLDRNDCTSSHRTWYDEPDGVCEQWQCKGAPFASCQVHAGRDWAGETISISNICAGNGPVAAFPYAEVIWEFLEREGIALTPAAERDDVEP